MIKLYEFELLFHLGTWEVRYKTEEVVGLRQQLQISNLNNHKSYLKKHYEWRKRCLFFRNVNVMRIYIVFHLGEMGGTI